MKWTIAGLLLLGVVAALATAVLVAGLRADSFQPAAIVETSAPTEVEVLVASRNLTSMTIVDANAVTKKIMKVEDVGENARVAYTDVVGQVLIAPMVEGEVFLQRHFAAGNSGVNVAAALPEGYRAMSAILADDTGISDILYPGCVVDVIASFRLPSQDGIVSGEILSATLLQGVQVLAIGGDSVATGETATDDDDDSTPALARKERRRVTFMVDADQAEALQLATSHGEISVAMRNPLDIAQDENRGVLLTDLSNDLASRLARMTAPGETADPIEVGDGNAPVTKAAEAWTTVVMRGRKPETVTFPAEEE